MTGMAIFDLDGVVRIWDPEIISGAERRAGLPVGSLGAVAFEPALLARVDVGGLLGDDDQRVGLGQVTDQMRARSADRLDPGTHRVRLEAGTQELPTPGQRGEPAPRQRP